MSEDEEIITEFLLQLEKQGAYTQPKHVKRSPTQSQSSTAAPSLSSSKGWQACCTSEAEGSRTPSPRWQLQPELEKDLEKLWDGLWCVGREEAEASTYAGKAQLYNPEEDVEKKALYAIGCVQAQGHADLKGNPASRVQQHEGQGWAPGVWSLAGLEQEPVEQRLAQPCMEEQWQQQQLGTKQRGVLEQLVETEELVKRRNRKRGKGKSRRKDNEGLSSAGHEDRSVSSLLASDALKKSESGENETQMSAGPVDRDSFDFVREAHIFDETCEQRINNLLSSRDFEDSFERFQSCVAKIRASFE